MDAFPKMDEVFKALADPSRRQLLDSLNRRNGQTLRELCPGLDMARQSVSKHLRVLEAANLITTVRRGREKLHYLNAAPINEIGERWITPYERGRVHALADLKRALEGTGMDKPSFVYTTYIRTSPERLWQALTDPAFTRRYWWDATFETDWKVGSTMRWHMRGVTIDDPEQVVLESAPFRRLSYTWHSLTPELAENLELSEDARNRIAAEQRSNVTFELEPLGELVKLTVVHDDFEPGSLMASLVSSGWPRVLSDIKTLLETGETMPGIPEPPVPTGLGLTTRDEPEAAADSSSRDDD
jgi:DNA-binding transcriptional ArsR family regulator